MVLDLMTQLDRESTERNKIETLLRELLDAKRTRKSEQLSADQLAEMARERQRMAERLSPDELAEMNRRRAALLPRGDEPAG